MEWCVCCDKVDGTLTIVSRNVREMMLSWWGLFSVIPPTYVVKVCNTIEDATKYVEEMKKVNDLIDRL